MSGEWQACPAPHPLTDSGSAQAGFGGAGQSRPERWCRFVAHALPLLARGRQGAQVLGRASLGGTTHSPAGAVPTDHRPP